LKIGLYSITYLGVWYDGPALSLPEMMARAKKFGYDGIEIDGKRPHGNPADLSSTECKEIRLRADAEGIEIYAVAANNDFSSPVTEHREAQLVYVRDLIRMTADLGAKILRVFAGWPGVYQSVNGASYTVSEHIWESVHSEFSVERIWDWSRECLIECAQWAQDAGITLALQNHPKVVNNYTDMLRMIREVDSPGLKASFDAPLARNQRVGDMRAAASEVGALQILTHFGGEYEEEANGEVGGWVRLRNGSLKKEDFYLDFVEGMRDIGYAGYMGYELCHPLPQVNGKPAGIDFVDQNARLAAKFMRRMLSKVHSEQAVAAR
jgi:sugar phosphate isomerase/epimerase